MARTTPRRSPLHKIVGAHAENGHKIREHRLAKKLSQTTLGEAGGVSYRQIIRYENGELLPPGVVRDRLADALGIERRLIESGDDDHEEAAPLGDPFRDAAGSAPPRRRGSGRRGTGDASAEVAA